MTVLYFTGLAVATSGGIFLGLGPDDPKPALVVVTCIGAALTIIGGIGALIRRA